MNNGTNFSQSYNLFNFINPLPAIFNHLKRLPTIMKMSNGHPQLRGQKQQLQRCPWPQWPRLQAEELGKAVAEAAKTLMDDEKLTQLSSEER